DLGDLEALAEAARRERDNGLSDAVLPSPDEVAAAGAASGEGSGSGTGTATATATATAPNRARETRIDDDTRLTGATSDHVRMYLKEIGKVPQLSGEEEVSLAQRVEAGLAGAERISELEEAYGGYRAIPRDQLLPLKRKVSDGLAAKE